MASFFDERRKQLGIDVKPSTTSSRSDKPRSSGGSTDFFERRRAELNKQKEERRQQSIRQSAERVEKSAPSPLPSVERQLRTATTAFTPQSVNRDLRPTFGPPAPEFETTNKPTIAQRLGLDKPIIGPSVSEIGQAVLTDPLLRGISRTASLGLGEDAIPKRRGEKPVLEKAGEFIGYLQPGAATEKIAAAALKPLVKNLPRAGRLASQFAGAGALFGTAQETAQELGGLNDQTLGQRALDVGIETVAGGALGALADVPRLLGGVGQRSAQSVLGQQVGAARAIQQAGESVPTGRLRVSSNTEQLSRLMGEIQPIVNERMTPPLENRNELAKWLRPHLGDTSLNEIRKLPYEDMRQLADDVRRNLTVVDVARTVARERGVDLDSLLNQTAPTFGQTAERLRLGGVAGAIEPPSSARVAIGEGYGQAASSPSPARQAPVPASTQLETPVTQAPPASVPAQLFPGVSQQVGIPARRPTTSATIAPRVAGERSFNRTLRESGQLTPEVESGLAGSEERFYNQITNADTVAAANQRIDRLGIDRAEGQIMSGKKMDTEDAVVGMRLIQKLQDAGEIERAVSIADQVSKKLTEAGQFIQAASIFNRLSPEGALIYATRKVREAGGELDSADAGSILNLATSIQKSGQSIDRASNVMDIATKIRNKEELSTDELKELTSFVEDVRSMLGTPKRTKTTKPARLPSDKKVREQMLNVLNEKEASLQEFIRLNKRRTSSTPLDLWGAYVALGAVKMAKGAISFSKWSEDMVREVGDDIRPHLSNLFDRSQREAEQLQHLLPPKSAAEKVAQKYIDAGNLSDKDARAIHDLATRIGKMNTSDKQVASREMQQILNKYEKSSIADKINALRYIAMLGNTSTQLVNAVSSPIMMLERFTLDAIQTPFDIARAKVTGGPRAITFKQGPQVWDNFFSPISDYLKGAKVGAESGWKGIDPAGITTQNDIRGLAWKSKWNPARWAEGALGAVMKGADYASYNAAVQTRLRQMAYLDALNKGIKGNDNIRSYMDRYLNNVDGNIVDLADKYGKEITFQSQTKASQGAQAAVRGLNKFSTLGATDKTGLGSALLPFVRTPTNILIAGLERTPLGLLKGLYDLSTMRKNGLTGREVASTFSKALYGTAGLTGAGYVLGSLGILTGDSSSKSKDVQALEKDIGQGKFKFNTTAFNRMMSALISGDLKQVERVSKFQPGDKQLNYNKLQPFAFNVAAGATFAEQQRRAQAAQARGANIPLTSQLGSAAVASGQSLFDMSLLNGLQDAFDTQPGEGVGDTVKRIAQNYAKSFSPSLGGQEARRQDELQRQVTYKGLTEPVTQYFQSRTPGQSQQLPPKVSTLGDLARNERGFIANYLNPLQSAETQYNEASRIIYDLIQQTGDEKLAPTPMDKSVRGKKNGVSTTVSLTPTQHAQLQQRVGEEITRRVLALPKGLAPATAAERIEEIYTEARKAGRDAIKKEVGLQ